MKNNILLILLISFIYPRRDCLQEAERDALGRSSSRDSTQDSTLSPSGHFFIHYDTTSQNSGKPPDLTDNDGNDIPDYIDQVGIMADSAHHVLVDIMGYEPEPFDSDSIYDIYVNSLSDYEYGYNWKAPFCTVHDTIQSKIDCENSSCLDIGANIGNHSIFFSKFFKQVLCYEPVELTHKLLEINRYSLSL